MEIKFYYCKHCGKIIVVVKDSGVATVCCGEDMVEIFCHGGPAVVTAIQNLMLRSGFRQANRGEYTFRAYINGKTDLTKAEAVREIIDSHTDDSRSHAAGRLAGSLYKEIDSIKKLLVDTLAAIEVEIEYPEDEETIADINRKLAGIETILLFTEPELTSVSSSVVRELISFGKDVSAFLPQPDNKE